MAVRTISARFASMPLRPLALRGVLLLCCALIATAKVGTAQALAPALLLLAVAAVASLPWRPEGARWAVVALEALIAGVVIGALGNQGAAFLPYLIAPALAAGLTGQVAVVLSMLASVCLALVSTSIAVSSTRQVGQTVGNISQWLLIAAAVSVIGAYGRRITSTADSRPATDAAYANAHRLLSELHVVARQLSLGLDPQTLGTAMLEEVRGAVDCDHVALLTRSAGGRFVPLVGDEMDDHGDGIAMDAWLSAEPATSTVRGRRNAAYPVRMGPRVVALVLMDGEARRLDRASVGRVAELLESAGPRLASALLFEDVRRLATTDERLRVARDIHDGVAQELASLGYMIDDIAGDASGEVAQRLRGLRKHVQSLTGELRLSIFDLRTGVDETVGLGTALSDHAQRISAQTDLIVHVVLDEGPQRLPVATEVELLRIAQEAVTNVRKHAGARNLWLQCHVDTPRAEIVVSDDGEGLKVARADSMGMTGMRERARRIGAVLEVKPREGGGTTVRVALDGALARTGTAAGAAR